MKSVTKSFVFLIILLMVFACSSKPSTEEFKKVAVSDFHHKVESRLGADDYGKSKKINDFMIAHEDDIKSIAVSLVIGDIEVNDDDMFPYKDTVYYLEIIQGSFNKKVVNDFVDLVSKKNQKELSDECKNVCRDSITPVTSFFGQKTIFECQKIEYKWGKKSKFWKTTEK